MARFYFHMQTGDHVQPDPEGVDLPSIEAARDEALLQPESVWPMRSRLPATLSMAL